MRRGGRSTPNDPTHLMIKMMVWSPEGQQAALDATRDGLPARRGVDLLLRKKFPQAYLRPTPQLRALVGSEVASVMRSLGYVPVPRVRRSERRWKLKPVTKNRDVHHPATSSKLIGESRCS